ncbi:MAG: putative toxin-antitoxin system toxin component, PIN family [Actinomycetota bacterium]|nr:putative toxin-antitoxin system toxin component, PIN family [Actinomycetota bacterium]
MSRVVLDTNVYISAYGFGGKPADVMRAAIAGKFELVTSPAILVELADKLETVLDFDREHTEEVVRQIARVATAVRPERRLAVVADDADNRILEAAAEAGAEFIVSGDPHLLELGTWEGVRVMRVAEFLGR